MYIRNNEEVDIVIFFIAVLLLITIFVFCIFFIGRNNAISNCQNLIFKGEELSGSEIYHSSCFTNAFKKNIFRKDYPLKDVPSDSLNILFERKRLANYQGVSEDDEDLVYLKILDFTFSRTEVREEVERRKQEAFALAKERELAFQAKVEKLSKYQSNLEDIDKLKEEIVSLKKRINEGEVVLEEIQ